MSELPSLFPVWKRWAGCVVGEVWTRALWVGSDGRQLVGYLSLLNGQAKFSARWEENGVFVMDIIGPFHAEGIGSLARAVQWAEWLVSDLGGEPRKRSVRRRRSVKVEEKEAA